MGAPVTEALPYRIKGIIFYARYIMIPLAILLVILLAERNGRYFITRMGISLLMAHGTLEMILRGSRSSLLLVVLLIIFLIMASGLKLSRKEKYFATFFLVLGLFMVPVMTEFRNIRILEQLPLLESLYKAIFNSDSNVFATLGKGFEFVFFRMPGVESISGIQTMTNAIGLKPLGFDSSRIFITEQGVAGYLTYTLYFIPMDSNTLSAPGIVGWLYIIGGTIGVSLGIIILTLAFMIGWKLISHPVLYCGTIARVFYLWMLFHVFTEGTIDAMGYMVVVGFVTLLGIEIMLRMSCYLHRLHMAKTKNLNIQ